MRIVLIFIIVFSIPLSGYGQLSPGDLHKTHAQLEGLENCTKCHAEGKKLDPDLCLQCHQMLKEKINSGEGLHANSDFKSCETCHVEHQGRNYDLIYWKQGIKSFNHTLTGYNLTGSHVNIDCRKCHSSEKITDVKTIRDANKDPDRTFLGLSQNCISCHINEHRGQLSEQCQTCHSTDKWKPASQFDHNKSAFKLTGKHIVVDCQKCHPTLEDKPVKDDASYAKLKNINHRYCTDCHTDIHKNRFGSNCVKCHSTAGWHGKAGTNFNHDRTNYPLKGRHRNIQCNICHKPGLPLKIRKYSACKDCHSDYHNKQFIQREQKGACEECHSVDGFSPSSFTIGMHAKTSYPLKGAHLAIPCFACHKKTNRKITFKFKSARCQTCHIDPHSGEVDQYLFKISSITNSAGCEHCHDETSWSANQFDHSQTKFSLEGKHITTECGRCHEKSSQGLVKIKNISTICQSCHVDIHLGQFKETDGTGLVKCDKCHAPNNWQASKFDHNTHSKFKLDGRHKSVKCGECHIQTEINELKFIRYRPMRTECKSCHANSKQPGTNQ
jgi:hypothetical protein